MISRKTVYGIEIGLLFLVVNSIIAIAFKTNIAMCIFMAIATVILLYKHNVATVQYFIICTVFQNIYLIIFSETMNGSETQAIILLKEMVIYIIAIVFIIKKIMVKPSLLEWLTLFFGIEVIYNILFISNSVGLSIVSARQIAVVFLAYYFGNAIIIQSDRDIEDIINLIIIMALIVASIGLFIYFSNDTLWDKLGYGQYIFNKTGSTRYNYTNFYTFDLGRRMKRFISIFADPLACSHFLGLALVLLILLRKHRNLLTKILVALGLIFGLSKGSVVLIICMIFVLNYSKIKNKLLKAMMIVGCIVMGTYLLSYLTDYTESVQQASSVSNHFNSFLYGFQNMTLLGKGLDSAGYNAYAHGAEYFDGASAESFFSVCISQMGIVGVVTIYCFMILIVKKAYALYTTYKNNYALVTFILGISVIIESFFSSSSISMLGTGIYFALIGIVNNYVTEKHSDVSSNVVLKRRKQLC